MSFPLTPGKSLLHRYDPRLKLVVLLAAAMGVHRASVAELSVMALGLSIALPVSLSPRRIALRQICSAFRFALVLLILSIAAANRSTALHPRTAHPRRFPVSI